MKNIAVVIVSLLAAACVQLPPTPDSRYLQYVYPGTHETIMQMTAPNGETCALWLSFIKRSPKVDKAVSDNYRCTPVSASNNMKAIAIIRNMTFRLSTDVETLTLSLCAETMHGFLAEADNITVLSECRNKD
ncbi:MAG: hypothetical protein JWN23_615 [Rhodocyclales bacterium]|nr:hypothetical protein [Rhodocyclales bacterium]